MLQEQTIMKTKRLLRCAEQLIITRAAGRKRKNRIFKRFQTEPGQLWNKSKRLGALNQSRSFLRPCGSITVRQRPGRLSRAGAVLACAVRPAPTTYDAQLCTAKSAPSTLAVKCGG